MTFDEYWKSEYPPLYDVGKAVARAAWDAASLDADNLRAENARLRAECEATNELREEISSWLKMLTTEIFTEPNFVKARALLEAGGMTLDGISASNMRHVLTRLAEKDKQARAARLTRADGE